MTPAAPSAHSSRGEHPLIAVYGDTLDDAFPLILVVGREPNNARRVGKRIGQYDFDLAPRCAFWNRAYTTAARAVSTTARELKHSCRERNASPMIFADISPVSIPDRVRAKNALRRSVLPAAIRDHIDHILSHDALLRRVHLAWLVGLDRPHHHSPALHLHQGLAARGIPSCSLPFFGRTPNADIAAAISSRASSRLASALRAFLRTPVS